ncbi:glutamate-5-semialdehyde dehydrogenase [Aneurinibacillus sp. Ricciae_BoGa-3]|uniref:glutamate-5-semialdehyde dehydrogenase n=1 Tax=Aneurinibacillus sp. Ricciae_BoGa-3 TaxID=3022697 RepID=UPI00234187EC|nr:glutamate-5-semialdehyde dehydrogenase [Aneurinibacillus sp. Ricciae_BoGa-3]WCK53962.1 glutamate-5-semialdehyde dehydrogenase [Aneurinibacillus sp. Ricciae_BoGa-3]
MTLLDKAARAKKAAATMALISTDDKNRALLSMASALEHNVDKILEANEADTRAARENGTSPSLVDRLLLTEARIKDMSDGLRQVAGLTDPIGEQLESWVRPNGLNITKVRVPLGVIGIIYEARPNVTVDAAGLCLKTGNAVLLRGSSSALHSNQTIVEVLHQALSTTTLPADAVQLLEEGTREEVNQMLKLNAYIDVLIPRGGAGLIKSVVNNATVPVLETGSGNCHIYIDETAEPEMAKRITVNAKVQRPAVCNSAETLLVHHNWAEQHLPSLLSALKEKGVELHGCERSRALAPDIDIIPAVEDDFKTEYLDYTMAVRVVDSVDEAITHIARYSTRHSESIVTSSKENADKFLRQVDSAAVYHNASTRFTDGFEFGFGAEIGISTQKLHARGPMGLPALTSSKYVIYGTGQIR